MIAKVCMLLFFFAVTVAIGLYCRKHATNTCLLYTSDVFSTLLVPGLPTVGHRGKADAILLLRRRIRGEMPALIYGHGVRRGVYRKIPPTLARTFKLLKQSGTDPLPVKLSFYKQ